MAREIAAETAETAPDPELPLVHGLLAKLGLPVVTRIHRERVPLVSWALALALVAVFVTELRGAGIDAAVARLGYGPDNRGLWAAVKAVFAHAGWGHLIGNCYFLLAFGDGVDSARRGWLRRGVRVLAGVAALLVDGALHPARARGRERRRGGADSGAASCCSRAPRSRPPLASGPTAVDARFLWSQSMCSMALLRVPGGAWTAHIVGLALGAGSALVLRRRPERHSRVMSSEVLKTLSGPADRYFRPPGSTRWRCSFPRGL